MTMFMFYSDAYYRYDASAAPRPMGPPGAYARHRAPHPLHAQQQQQQPQYGSYQQSPADNMYSMGVGSAAEQQQQHQASMSLGDLGGWGAPANPNQPTGPYPGYGHPQASPSQRQAQAAAASYRQHMYPQQDPTKMQFPGQQSQMMGGMLQQQQAYGSALGQQQQAQQQQQQQQQRVPQHYSPATGHPLYPGSPQAQPTSQAYAPYAASSPMQHQPGRPPQHVYGHAQLDQQQPGVVGYQQHLTQSASAPSLQQQQQPQQHQSHSNQAQPHVGSLVGVQSQQSHLTHSVNQQQQQQQVQNPQSAQQQQIHPQLQSHSKQQQNHTQHPGLVTHPGLSASQQAATQQPQHPGMVGLNAAQPQQLGQHQQTQPHPGLMHSIHNQTSSLGGSLGVQQQHTSSHSINAQLGLHQQPTQQHTQQQQHQAYLPHAASQQQQQQQPYLSATGPKQPTGVQQSQQLGGSPQYRAPFPQLSPQMSPRPPQMSPHPQMSPRPGVMSPAKPMQQSSLSPHPHAMTPGGPSPRPTGSQQTVPQKGSQQSHANANNVSTLQALEQMVMPNVPNPGPDYASYRPPLHPSQLTSVNPLSPMGPRMPMSPHQHQQQQQQWAPSIGRTGMINPSPMTHQQLQQQQQTHNLYGQQPTLHAQQHQQHGMSQQLQQQLPSMSTQQQHQQQPHLNELQPVSSQNLLSLPSRTVSPFNIAELDVKKPNEFSILGDSPLNIANMTHHIQPHHTMSHHLLPSMSSSSSSSDPIGLLDPFSGVMEPIAPNNITPVPVSLDSGSMSAMNNSMHMHSSLLSHQKPQQNHQMHLSPTMPPQNQAQPVHQQALPSMQPHPPHLQQPQQKPHHQPQQHHVPSTLQIPHHVQSQSLVQPQQHDLPPKQPSPLPTMPTRNPTPPPVAPVAVLPSPSTVVAPSEHSNLSSDSFPALHDASSLNENSNNSLSNIAPISQASSSNESAFRLPESSIDQNSSSQDETPLVENNTTTPAPETSVPVSESEETRDGVMNEIEPQSTLQQLQQQDNSMMEFESTSDLEPQVDQAPAQGAAESAIDESNTEQTTEPEVADRPPSIMAEPLADNDEESPAHPDVNGDTLAPEATFSDIANTTGAGDSSTLLPETIENTPFEATLVAEPAVPNTSQIVSQQPTPLQTQPPPQQPLQQMMTNNSTMVPAVPMGMMQIPPSMMMQPQHQPHSMMPQAGGQIMQHVPPSMYDPSGMMMRPGPMLQQHPGLSGGYATPISHQAEQAALQQQLQELYCMPPTAQGQEKMLHLQERMSILQQHETNDQCNGGPTCILQQPTLYPTSIMPMIESPQVSSTTGRGRKGTGTKPRKPRPKKADRLAAAQSIGGVNADSQSGDGMTKIGTSNPEQLPVSEDCVTPGAGLGIGDNSQDPTDINKMDDSSQDNADMDASTTEARAIKKKRPKPKTPKEPRTPKDSTKKKRDSSDSKKKRSKKPSGELLDSTAGDENNSSQAQTVTDGDDSKDPEASTTTSGENSTLVDGEMMDFDDIPVSKIPNKSLDESTNRDDSQEDGAATTPKKSKRSSASRSSSSRRRGTPGAIKPLPKKKLRHRGRIIPESDGEPDDLITTPPPSPTLDDCDFDSSKRRSARNTQRKKYIDDVMLSISDEEAVMAPAVASKASRSDSKKDTIAVASSSSEIAVKDEFEIKEDGEEPVVKSDEVVATDDANITESNPTEPPASPEKCKPAEKVIPVKKPETVVVEAPVIDSKPNYVYVNTTDEDSMVVHHVLAVRIGKRELRPEPKPKKKKIKVKPEEVEEKAENKAEVADNESENKAEVADNESENKVEVADNESKPTMDDISDDSIPKAEEIAEAIKSDEEPMDSAEKSLDNMETEETAPKIEDTPLISEDSPEEAMEVVEPPAIVDPEIPEESTVSSEPEKEDDKDVPNSTDDKEQTTTAEEPKEDSKESQLEETVDVKKADKVEDEEDDDEMSLNDIKKNIEAEKEKAKEDKALASNSSSEDSSSEEEEDEADKPPPVFIDIEEYYVKYRNFSYLHCEWRTEEELFKGDRRVAAKIKRFQMKQSQQLNIFENLEEDPFNPDFIETDRVLDMSVHHDEASGTTTNHYLVKWKSLPYEDCTWELEADVDAAKIEQYKRFSKIPPKDKWKAKRRPTPDQWKQLDETPIYKGGNSLRAYQLEGLNWLKFSYYNSHNCILADEMGLGKTIQSLTFVHSCYQYGIRGPYLVIAPLSTIPNWQREFESWTDMNIVVYHGSQTSKQMLAEYEFYYKNDNGKTIKDLTKFNVLITTFEMIVTDYMDLRNFHWRACVIDEAHRLKNRNCKLLEGLRTLSLEHRVLLSGTPLQNNVNELFSLLNFLEPTQFSSSDAFMAEFGSLKTESEVQKLQALLKPMMLRRLKDDVEKSLAPKTETIVEVELTNIQKKYYRGILEQNFSFLKKGTTSQNIPNLMNTMMELRKCCIHPYLLNGAEDQIQYDSRHSLGEDNESYYKNLILSAGKMVLIDKLLPKLKANGHRVLIFSQMVRCLDILEDYLIYKKYPFERIDGRIRGNLRQAAIDRYSKPDSDRFVFLLCTKAGGLGINLTAADTVIIYDSDWNPQNDLQAQARCHRIGQQKLVKIYRLLCRNTYEREMFDKASMKLGLDKAILQSMNTGLNAAGKEAVTRQLTKKEIEDLLKKGAYGAVMDDDNAADKFCEEDIDSILERRTQVITMESEKGSTFSKASFGFSGNRSDISIDDPEFWTKWAKKAEINETLGDVEVEDLVISEPRRRTQIKRYGHDEGVLEGMSEESANNSETDEEGGGIGLRSRRRRGEKLKKGRPGNGNDDYIPRDRDSMMATGQEDVSYGTWARSECFKVEKGLLSFG